MQNVNKLLTFAYFHMPKKLKNLNRKIFPAPRTRYVELKLRAAQPQQTDNDSETTHWIQNL